MAAVLFFLECCGVVLSSWLFAPLIQNFRVCLEHHSDDEEPVGIFVHDCSFRVSGSLNFSGE